ncbi:type II secretion system protein [Anatilimnocola aggregata]|nr:type II secretion system protein [Anatilimnocola aggregata]
MRDDNSQVSTGSTKPATNRLVWVLVGLSLVCLLLAVSLFLCVLPIALQSVRESVRRNQVQQNMQQLKAAIEAYEARQLESPLSPERKKTEKSFTD